MYSGSKTDCVTFWSKKTGGPTFLVNSLQSFHHVLVKTIVTIRFKEVFLLDRLYFFFVSLFARLYLQAVFLKQRQFMPMYEYTEGRNQELFMFEDSIYFLNDTYVENASEVKH